MPLSTSQLRTVWGPSCATSSELTQFVFWTGVQVTVNRACVEAWRALDTILKDWGYAPRKADTGAYNCRTITGGTGLSLHSFGIACDINWQSNPYGPNLVTDMPDGMVDDILTIRTLGGQQVFRWGGDYTGNKDAMHYEVVCSPTELAAGIDWTTVNAEEPMPTPITDADVGALRVASVLALYDECKLEPDAEGLAFWIAQAVGPLSVYWDLRAQFLGAVAASIGLKPESAPDKPDD